MLIGPPVPQLSYRKASEVAREKRHETPFSVRHSNPCSHRFVLVRRLFVDDVLRQPDRLRLGFGLLLRLPNTASNVADGLASIRAFVAEVKGRRVRRDEVEPILSVAAKEKERLSFFRELTV